MSGMDTRQRYKEALEVIADGCDRPERVAIRALNPPDTRTKWAPVVPGQWYGRLQVVYSLGCIHVTETGEDSQIVRPDVMWLCWCECGAFTMARTHNLRKHKKQSCGCLRKMMAGAKNRNMYRVTEKWRRKRDGAFEKLRTAARKRAKAASIEAARAQLEATKRKLIPYAGYDPSGTKAITDHNNGWKVKLGFDRV